MVEISSAGRKFGRGFPENVRAIVLRPMALDGKTYHLIAFHEKLPDALVIEIHGANSRIRISDEQVQR
jgi:hypothetical protein